MSDNDSTKPSLDGFPSEPPALKALPGKPPKGIEQAQVAYAELTDIYRQLYGRLEAALEQIDKLEAEQAETRKTLKVATGEADKLKEENNGFKDRVEELERKLRESEVTNEGLLNNLEDIKSFYRHFATVIAAFSYVTHHGTDPFRIVPETDEIENGWTQTAENEVAQVKLSSQNDRLTVWIRAKHPNTGEPATKWISLGQVVGELSSNQFLHAASLIGFSFDDLPNGNKDELSASDQVYRTIGKAALHDMLDFPPTKKSDNDGLEFDQNFGDIHNKRYPYGIPTTNFPFKNSALADESETEKE